MLIAQNKLKGFLKKNHSRVFTHFFVFSLLVEAFFRFDGTKENQFVFFITVKANVSKLTFPIS